MVRQALWKIFKFSELQSSDQQNGANNNIYSIELLWDLNDNMPDAMQGSNKAFTIIKGKWCHANINVLVLIMYSGYVRCYPWRVLGNSLLFLHCLASLRLLQNSWKKKKEKENTKGHLGV